MRKARSAFSRPPKTETAIGERYLAGPECSEDPGEVDGAEPAAGGVSPRVRMKGGAKAPPFRVMDRTRESGL